MPLNPEVIIVGGGVLGCATAYFLAKEGVQTTLIEREAVGSCASGFAAGLLNPLSGNGIPGPLEPLAQESFRLHCQMADELESETGIDTHFRSTSCIWTVLGGDDASVLNDMFKLANRHVGFPARWLDTAELRSLEPRLSPRVTNALCVEGMRLIGSYQYTLALAEAATKYGATILRGTVQGLRKSNGRVTGVILGSTEMSCDKVVLAMGPWAAQAESWLEFSVPIGPLKGQILRLELEGPPLEHIFYHAGDYVSSKADGLIWAGTTEERVGFDDRTTPEARDSILKGATEIVPALSNARVVLQTACLRPVSEDGLPIVGEVTGMEGVYLATGAGRKGILLGPGIALAIADLATAGHTNLSIGPFSPARFARSECGYDT